MKRMNIKKIMYLSLFVIGLQGQSQLVMESLLLSPSAKSAGRADNGVANPTNAALAMHFNPAGLLFDKTQQGFQHSFTYLNPNSGLPTPDGFYTYLSSSYKFPKVGAFGASIRYMTLGDQEFTEVNSAIPQFSFGTYEFEMSVAYARHFSDEFSVGFKGSFLKSQLVEDGKNLGTDENPFLAKSPSTMAIDLGALYKFGGNYNINLGAALSNLGGKMQFLVRSDGQRVRSNIPTIFRLGLTADVHEFRDHLGKLTGGIEARFLSAVGEAIGINVNYEFAGMLELRTGFVFDNNVFKSKNYFTTGVGFRHSGYDFDFSYQMMSADLGQVNPSDGTLNLSVAANFEQPYFNDEQAIPDFGYDPEKKDEYDKVDVSNADDAVEKYDDKGALNSLYNKLERDAGYEVVESAGYSGETALVSELYDEAFMEKISRTNDFEGIDYLVSDNIIMVVLADKSKSFKFNVSHLKFNLTDSYSGNKDKLRYIKGSKGRSIVIFNIETSMVERAYTETKDEHIFFVVEQIKYRYNRESKKTEIIEFIE